MRRLLLSLIATLGVAAQVLASGAVPPCRSDRLEKMAEALGAAQMAALPDGENTLQTGGRSLCVIKSAGMVEHIGYRFFSPETRALTGAVVCNFLERYALEADLPLPREKTIPMQLVEDGISFPRGGGLDDLKRLTPDTPISLTLVSGRKYLFEWNGLAMVFPVDAELLLGRSQGENDRRLPSELANAPAPQAPSIPEAASLTPRADGLLVEEGGSYYLESLNACRYFISRPDGTLQAVDTPAHAGETLANMLCGLVDPGEITVQVKMSVYGIRQNYFTIPLRALAGYAQQNGCTPYWGIIAADQELLEGELILRNEAAGYNHVLRLQVPFAVLGNKEGSIQVRLTPFVPTHSLKYLFEETRQ